MTRLLWPPIAVLVAYALCVGHGFGWPHRPGVTEGLAIGVSLVCAGVVMLGLAGAGAHRWTRRIGAPALLLGLLPLGVGAASLGPDVALEQRSETVPVVVTAAEEHTAEVPDQGVSRHREWVDYRFRRLDGRPVDGVVTYAGNTEGYGLHPGDRTELYIDPTGTLPIALVSESDPDDALGILVTGAVYWLVVWGVISLLTFRRRRRH